MTISSPLKKQEGPGDSGPSIIIVSETCVEGHQGYKLTCIRGSDQLEYFDLPDWKLSHCFGIDLVAGSHLDCRWQPLGHTFRDSE